MASKKEELYSKSKRAPTTWNGDSMGFLTATNEEMESRFVENKFTHGIMVFSAAGKAQVISMPIITRIALEDGTYGQEKMLVGNASDKIEHHFPVRTTMRAVNHTLVVIPKELVHPVFKNQLALTKEHIKDTMWGEEEGDVVVFAVPSACPLPFGTRAPKGSINDQDFQQDMKKLGGEYEAWAEAMRYAYKNTKDTKLIIYRLTNKSGDLAKYVHKDWGTKYRSMGDNYAVNINIFDDSMDAPEAYEEIAAVFGKKPVKENSRSSEENVARAPMLLNVINKEDEEKKEQAKFETNNLELLLSTSGDVNFEMGATSLKDGLGCPEWTPTFEEAIKMKGDSKIDTARAIMMAPFEEQTSVSAFTTDTMIKGAASMKYLSKNTVTQLLKGNMDVVPCNSLYTEKTAVSIECFAYQEEGSEKVKAQILKEKTAQSEVDYNVPDTQRSIIETNIVPIGSYHKMYHAIGTLANIALILKTMTKSARVEGERKPVILTCVLYLFNYLTSQNVKYWIEKHEHEMPQLPYYITHYCDKLLIGTGKHAKFSVNKFAARSGDWDKVTKEHMVDIVDITKELVGTLKKHVRDDVPCLERSPNMPERVDPHFVMLRSVQQKVESSLNTSAARKTGILKSNHQGAVAFQEGDNKRKRSNSQDKGNGESRGRGRSNSFGSDRSNRSRSNSVNSDSGGRSRSNSFSTDNRDKKAMGTFMPIPGQPFPKPSDVFGGKDMRYTDLHCFDFHMVGRECTNKNCTFKHVSLPRMEAHDRDIMLGHCAKVKKVYLNPGLKKANSLKDVLCKFDLFPPQTALTGACA